MKTSGIVHGGEREVEPGFRSATRRVRVGLCYSDCNNRGGIERVLLEAAKHLATSCEVSVLAGSFPENNELPSTVEQLQIRSVRLPMGFGLPWERYWTDRLVRGGPWDVVGGFGVQAPAGSVVWVPSVHAAWWEQGRTFRKGSRRFLQTVNPFHRIVLRMENELFRGRRYRRLIALSPRVRDDLVRFYDVDPNEVDLLPNGFVPEEFHPSLQDVYRERLRRCLGIPNAAKVVLFVANEWERKGLLPLMEAVAGLKDTNVHLVVAGNLPKAFVESKAFRLGNGSNVHVVGPTGRVNRWFGIADVFALPTVYEAWGMVVIEALAAGLPVLASHCAGSSVAVREGFNGHLLEDPRDVVAIQQGVRKILNGVAWSASEIGASVSEYRWHHILARYEKILKNCV